MHHWISRSVRSRNRTDICGYVALCLLQSAEQLHVSCCQQVVTDRLCLHAELSIWPCYCQSTCDLQRSCPTLRKIRALTSPLVATARSFRWHFRHASVFSRRQKFKSSVGSPSEEEVKQSTVFPNFIFLAEEVIFICVYITTYLHFITMFLSF